MKNFTVIILSAICLYSAANGSDRIRLNEFNDQPGGAVQTIRGHVTDAASGHPLPYVTITIEEIAGKGTVADPEGNFVLSDVPVGRQTLIVSYVGYEPAVIREVLVTSAKEVVLEISMNEMIQSMEDVVVRPRVNKQEPLNQMALAGGRMFSVEEASRYAGGMDDPARLVSSFAGVSPSVTNNGISVHGNAPHLLQWKLEDVEIPNPNHYADISILGGGILSSLSSHVLGNSDFFTGAFPAEYGNAVSGVFDMKLRNGNNRSYENTVQVGVLGLDVASEGPFGKESNASYIFNYRYSTLGLISKLDKSQELGGAFDYQDLNLKMNFPTRVTGTFSVWVTGLIDKYDETSEDREKWEHLHDRMASNMKQSMGAAGISNRYLFRNQSVLKTTFAVTYSRHKGYENSYDDDLVKSPYLDLDRQSTNLILTSAYTKKFGARHTNKTGFTFTRMYYDMFMDMAPFIGDPLENISKGDGSTNLISAYSLSSISLKDRLTFNAGVYGQILTLNDTKSIEPRASVKWRSGRKSSLAFSYGLHSRMEKMDVYYVRTPQTGSNDVNRNLGFTKAHHLLLSFGYDISDRIHFRVEPFYQYLFNVPVVEGNSESTINRNDFFVENPFVNKGNGRNYGIDLTLERYLHRGFYYMATLSLFQSEYRGGDDVWRDTRYNRNYIFNILGGKEWMLGRKKENILSVNVKLTFQGGERYTPVDIDATLAQPDLSVVYDTDRAFSKQLDPVFLANFNISYTLNRRKVAHEFALKMLNATRYKEYYGDSYNLKTGNIDKMFSATSIPNISYKIQF